MVIFCRFDLDSGMDKRVLFLEAWRELYLYSKKDLERLILKRSVALDVSWQRKIISFLTAFPYRIARFFYKKKFPQQPKKILVIQWDYLGDIIVSTPALRTLRDIYSSAEIHLVTSPENKSYIDGFSFVNRMLYLKNPLHAGRGKFTLKDFFNCISKLRKEKYDFIIELTGRLPNQIFLPFLRTDYSVGLDPANNFYFLDRRVHSNRKHQTERYLDAVNAVNKNNSNCSLELWNPATEEDRLRINKLLQEKGIYNNFVIIHSTASWKPRQWPIERWKKVLNFLTDKGGNVVFIGATEEYNQIEQIRRLLKGKNNFNFAGLISVRETIALMEKADFFIGNDSGPMHLAAVAKLKAIVLFGPGDPIKWGYSFHKIIYKEPPCSPCPQFAFRDKCVKGLSICKGLLAITSDEVIEKCEEFLIDKKEEKNE